MPLLPPAPSDFTNNIKQNASIGSILSPGPIQVKSTSFVPIVSVQRAASIINRSIISQRSNVRVNTPTATAASTVLSLPPITAGLVLMVDASYTPSIVTSGTRLMGVTMYSLVDSIQDARGTSSGPTGTPADTSKKAIYVPSVNDTFRVDSQWQTNGLTPTNKPAIYFRGNNVLFERYNWTLGQQGNPIAMFAVFQMIYGGPNWGGGGSAFGTSDHDSYIGYSSAYDAVNYYGDTEMIMDGSVTVSSKKTPVLLTHADTVVSSTKRRLLRVNGVQRGIVNSAASNNGYHNFNNFRNFRGSTLGQSTILHELLIYNTVLSSSDITSIESYLQSKWNLTYN